MRVRARDNLEIAWLPSRGGAPPGEGPLLYTELKPPLHAHHASNWKYNFRPLQLQSLEAPVDGARRKKEEMNHRSKNETKEEKKLRKKSVKEARKVFNFSLQHFVVFRFFAWLKSTSIICLNGQIACVKNINEYSCEGLTQTFCAIPIKNQRLAFLVFDSLRWFKKLCFAH